MDSSDLVRYFEEQDRVFAVISAKWERFAAAVAREIIDEILTVEYVYEDDPPPRPRRNTQLLGTVG